MQSDVLVVGGGAAGTLTVLALIRRATAAGRELRLTVAEPAACLGRGVAYSHGHGLRLNVPASGMSALVDDPGHFLRWLQRRDPTVAPTAFAARADFGSYVEETLEAVRRDGTVHLDHVRDTVTDLQRRADGGVRATFGRGQTLEAGFAVLASGVETPRLDWAPPTLLGSPRFVANPWAPSALDALAETPVHGSCDDVLVVGTGLTGVDVALLLDRPGRVVHAVSRRGRLPQGHTTAALTSVPAEVAEFQAEVRDRVRRAPATAEALVDVVSGAVGHDARRARNWRWALDALRPVSQETWVRLPEAEKRTLATRHAAWWELHRHRIAPEVAGRLGDMRSGGRLTVSAATVADAREVQGGLEVDLTDGRRVVVAYVVNCAGQRPEPSTGTLAHRLVTAGLATHGPLRMGLATQDGQLIDASGQAEAPIWTLGLLRRGELWETMAIPEIREQADRIAGGVLARLGAEEGLAR